MSSDESSWSEETCNSEDELASPLETSRIVTIPLKQKMLCNKSPAKFNQAEYEVCLTTSQQTKDTYAQSKEPSSTDCGTLNDNLLNFEPRIFTRGSGSNNLLFLDSHGNTINSG